MAHNFSPKSLKKIALLENEGLQGVHSIKIKSELTNHEAMCINKIAHDYWVLISDDKIKDSFESKLSKYNDNKHLVDAILTFIVDNPQ
jgi:hypothetical protein